MSADDRRKENEDKRESGLPGGGAGRRDSTEGSPIYPGTGPFPPGDSITMTPGQMGGGDYEESGRSEIFDPANHKESPEKKV